MDFPQFQIARPELKDLRRPNLSQHVYVEVALVDRSQPGVRHHVFQLNNVAGLASDQLDRLRYELNNMHRDAFTFLGEVVEIDSDKKNIYLSDGNMITYRYLIVVESPCETNEFNAFLPTLKDVLLLEALNAKAKIAQNQPRSVSPYEVQTQQSFNATESSDTKVSPLVQKRIACTDAPQGNQSMQPKRLCQVKS